MSAPPREPKGAARRRAARGGAGSDPGRAGLPDKAPGSGYADGPGGSPTPVPAPPRRQRAGPASVGPALNSGAKPAIRVVAGVISDSDGRILLSLRPDHLEHGGLWEFPGGKLKRRERPVEGLARELWEEIGIRIHGAVPLIRLCHEYPDKIVLLDVWEVRRWRDQPRSREDQQLKWVDPRELDAYRFPDADKTVVSACRLPRLQLITPAPGADLDGFLARLSVCLAAGVTMVQLRIKPYSPGRHRRLAQDVLRTCRAFGARLILNADPAEVHAVEADGVHLSSARLAGLRERPLGARHLVGASCHDLEELERARRLDVDFVLVSPVRYTASHPGARPLGWSGLRRLVRRTAVPVYALGGMEVEDLGAAARAGCQGVAMIRGIWCDGSLGRLPSRIDAALRSAEQEVCIGASDA